MKKIRKILTPFALITFFLILNSCSQPSSREESKSTGGEMQMPFEIKSTAFKNNETIPTKYTCDSDDPSPELHLSGIPEGTKSISIIMDDPDAPPGTWVHWLIYDLPPNTTKLEEGISKVEKLPNGASQGIVWGVKDSDFDRVGYYGPCPPPGKPHRYFFKAYCLDKVLGLAPRSTKTQLLKAMEGHTLAQAQVIGLYKR